LAISLQKFGKNEGETGSGVNRGEFGKGSGGEGGEVGGGRNRRGGVTLPVCFGEFFPQLLA
jgi:hypothetical protein